MAPSQNNTFGTLLHRYRRAAHLTQETLAARAGLSVEAISALERGTRQAPRKDTVQLLVEALALTPAESATLQQATQRREHTSLYGSLTLPADSAMSPLVGRAEDLACAERFLATPGQRLLLLAGEPGIGKTRLLSQVAHDASTHGWCVLQGGCFPHSGQVTYAPVLEVLRGYITAQPPTRLREVLQRSTRLDTLFPELSAVMPRSASAPPTIDQTREQLFAAVATFLCAIAGAAGTLLVLDDMQWAGEDALALLSALLRSPDGACARVVAAYSAVEVQPRHPLLMMSTHFARAGLVQHAQIGPLGASEAEALLTSLVPAEQLDPEIAQQALSHAGGVPFFLVSCAHGLRSGALGKNGVEAIPWDAAETVRQRVAMLPEHAGEVIGIAAIADRVVPRAVLIAVARETGSTEEATVAALDAACHARLLAEEGDDAYTFAHGFIREVIWSDLGAARRAALHRRVGEVLEHQPGSAPAEVLAYHFTRCGEHARAATYLELAGDRASQAQAHTAAAAFYRDLVDQCALLDRPEDVARAREKLGGALRVLAHYDEALRALKEAARSYHALGDLEGWRRVTAQIGRVHARRGTAREGIAAVRALLPKAKAPSGADGANAADGADAPDEGEATAGYAALHLALAELAQATGHYQQQLREAARAEDIATRIADASLRAQAEHWRGSALLALGRGSEALPALQEALPLAEAVGNLSLHAQTLSQVALAHINRGEFPQAQESIAQALEVAEQRGDPAQTALMICNRGMVGIYIGTWKEARADFETAAARMAEIDMLWGRAYPLLGLGQLSMLQGQYGIAVRLLQEATTQAERLGDLLLLCLIQMPLIERDLLEHRAEVAHGRLGHLLQSDRSVVLESTAYLLTLAAWVALEQDDLPAAERLLAQSVERAAAEAHVLARMNALLVRSRLATRREAWADAIAAAEEAVTTYQAMPYPCGEARALTVLGTALAGSGELRLARKRLDGAAMIYTQLGERLFRKEVDSAIEHLVH